MQQANQFYHHINKESYALLIIQLKQFSSLLWNHEQDMISKIAAILSTCLRKKEALFLDQDNYLIFLRRSHRLDIMNWIAEADDAIEQFPSFHMAIGICFLKDSNDFSNAVKKAHFALTHSKDFSHYTTSYEFFNWNDANDWKAAENMEHYLPHALKNGQFQIFLQPKIDTETKKIAGAEALLRLFQGSQEIPISSILSHANKNAFIRILDLFVLEQTCTFLQYCRTQQLPLFPISINISPLSFADGVYYLEEVKKIRNHFQIPPQLIEFELSEAISLSDNTALYPFLNQLQTAGHRIALDDFGSGYASLTLLGNLPVDIIKLDQRFFQTKWQNKQQILLQSLIQMLQQLEFTIIAEGVENKQTAEFLSTQKVDMIQGFYFYRPLSIPAYLKLLKQEKSNGTNDVPML